MCALFYILEFVRKMTNSLFHAPNRDLSIQGTFSYLKVTKFSDILNLASLVIFVFLLNLVHAKPAKCMSINYINS